MPQDSFSLYNRNKRSGRILQLSSRACVSQLHMEEADLTDYFHLLGSLR